MSSLRAPLAVLAVVAVAGATVTATASGKREAHAAKTVQVAVKDDFFAPDSLTVTKGTRVKWVWKGRDEHNVTVTRGPSTFASSTKRKGDFARTLNKAGTYRIICTIHDQRMKLVVRKPG